MNANPQTRETVAIAGAGDVAKYLFEELTADGRFDIVVLSRADREWFTDHGANLKITDYSVSSIQSILDSTQAKVLFSFLHDNTPFYNRAHESMLAACQQSQTCKRFVPSEYGGDIDKFPHLPRFYDTTNVEFRKVLAAQDEVEWTLVNIGWFMDYFVSPEKSYLKPLPGVWPIDLDKWEAVVPGSGDYNVGWTSGRDVANALVRLVDLPKWEKHTYVCGEVGTWNEALAKLEAYHGGRPFSKSTKSTTSIEKALVDHANDEDPTLLWTAFMDEWNITGASVPPWDEVLRQRASYFSGVKFRTIDDILKAAEMADKI